MQLKSVTLSSLLLAAIVTIPQTASASEEYCYEALGYGPGIVVKLSVFDITISYPFVVHATGTLLRVYLDGVLFHDASGAGNLTEQDTERADGTPNTHTWYDLWSAIEDDLDGSPGGEFMTECTSGCTGAFFWTLGEAVSCP